MKTLIACWTVATVACTSHSSGGPDPGQDAPPDSAPGRDIRIEVYGSTTNTTLVALQDGDGPWTELAGTAGVYTGSVHSERFGVASGCTFRGQDAFVTIAMQTVADGTTVQVLGCRDDAPTVTLGGPIVGAPTSASVSVAAGAAGSTLTFDDSYTMQVRPGAIDLVASLSKFDDDTAARILRKPALNVTTDTTLSLDFASDGLAYDRPALTVDDPDASSSTTLVVDGALYYLEPLSFDSSTSYLGVPAALMQPGDLQVVEVSGADNRSTTTVGVAGPLAVELPAAFDAPMPVVLDDRYPRVSARFSPGGGTLPIIAYELDCWTSNTAVAHDAHWLVTMSEAWAGASTVDVTLPDLSMLPSFDPTFALERGMPIDVFISRTEATDRDPIAGGRSMIASSRFTLGGVTPDHVARHARRPGRASSRVSGSRRAWR